MDTPTRAFHSSTLPLQLTSGSVGGNPRGPCRRAGMRAALGESTPLLSDMWNGQPHQLAAFTRHTIKLTQAEPTPRADLHRSANELVALELTRTAMHTLATRTTPPHAFLRHTHERNTKLP
jgi:hypothetical protein